VFFVVGVMNNQLREILYISAVNCTCCFV